MTPGPKPTPAGAWASDIAAIDLVAGAASLTEVIADGDDIWFGEARPEQDGRVAIMRWRQGTIVEVTPADANVRTRVHEYGGGAWFAQDQVLWYVDDSDQRLRRLDPDGTVTLLTNEPSTPRGVRFADGRPTADGRSFICVRETHHAGTAEQVDQAEPNEPVNDLVMVAGDGSGNITVLAAGADFYASPRISADGRTLAWVQWNHPNMPWDTTELWAGTLTDDGLSRSHKVAGSGDESIVLPGFAADGALWAVTDRDEWWNLWEFAVDATSAEPLVEGPFEIATPGWVFGISRWVEIDGEAIIACTDPGGDTLLATINGEVRDDWSAVSALTRHGDAVVFIGARHDAEPALVRWVPGSEPEILRPGRDLGLDPAYFAAPDHIVFPTSDGEEAHGWYYAPANPEHLLASGELPPLLVLAHGGPTARARTELSLAVRYWTSRGFAVVDVDYRGSTGYGRTYRQALHNRWGIADVDDCVAAALHLVDTGVVDADRVLIKGSSAGGLTVLGALVSTDTFAAGASRYGVADLSALAEHTHKFEARYCDRLVAPWPEGRDIYEARSPINRTQDLETPMIVLQGDADPVVPKNQSDAVVAALAANGVPHAYLVFPGVAHGFRDAETIITALEAELSFFCQILDIEPAGEIPALTLS